jgi:hypothetical protein
MTFFPDQDPFRLHLGLLSLQKIKEAPRVNVASENLARGHGSGRWIRQQQNEPLNHSYDVSSNKYDTCDLGVTTASAGNE